MIDFRYHLVSIVSIFLALAVGIVLGAGPLKGDIGTRLTEQVTALRAEKAQLRTDLDASRREAAAGDTFASALAPAITRNRLAGKTVALVVVPGADADLIKNTSDSLVAAGAEVGSTITLTDAWADPSGAAARNSLAGRYAALITAPLEASSPDQRAASVLANAILAGTDRSTDRATSSARAALDGMEEADLIEVTPDQIIPSSSAVMVGGIVKGSSEQDTEARLAAYVQLVGLLDAAGSGVVVATKSSTTELTQAADLVAAVRKDSDTVKVASTVDNADLSMGLSTLILAVEEQYAGKAGHYGLAADAKAILPDVESQK